MILLEKLKKSIDESTSIRFIIYNEVCNKKTLILSSVREVSKGKIKWKIIFKEPVVLLFYMKSMTNNISLEIEEVEQVTFTYLLNVYINCNLYYTDGKSKEFYIPPDVYEFNFEIRG